MDAQKQRQQEARGESRSERVGGLLHVLLFIVFSGFCGVRVWGLAFIGFGVWECGCRARDVS